MSIKSDGNNYSLLKNLQHRRVVEILGGHIPNDEASLLSNGRLTCTVCSKRPIFDTIQMLSLHRKGKKHLLELSIYLQHKRELECKKAKQTQRSFLKTDQITIEHGATHSFASCPQKYAKRKRYNTSFYRKFLLDITESCDRIKNNINLPSVVSSSANSQVRKYLKSLSRKQSLEKTVHELRESYGGSSSQGRVFTQETAEVKKPEEKKATAKQLDYHIKLLESGWMQDSNGKWIKDPNVEFDSDEEEPPSFS